MIIRVMTLQVESVLQFLLLLLCYAAQCHILLTAKVASVSVLIFHVAIVACNSFIYELKNND